MTEWEPLDDKDWKWWVDMKVTVSVREDDHRKCVRFLQDVPGAGLARLTYTLEIPEDVLLSIVRQLGYHVS